MIWYVLASGILLYFFELVGRYILSILKIEKFNCCFGIGIISFLAYSYITTFLITSTNGSFYIVSIIYSLFFIIFSILIIRYRKKISFKINIVNILVLIVFVFVMLLYAYNTTLGSLDGFDSTFYLNFVTSNIKSNHMNYYYIKSSLEQSLVAKTYTFQTYYYVASYITYIFSNIINVFHKTYYQTTFIWIFQILFNSLFYSLIVNSISILINKKNRLTVFIIMIFFLFVYGRVYYYNVYGFYGNTYRIITTGYSTLLLYLLTKKEKDYGLMTLFMISLLGSASVSSSSLFINIFILFGAYFILCNKYDDILKCYSIPLFFILTNLLSTSLGTSIIVSILVSLAISVSLFIFGNRLNEILSKKKILIAILSLSIAFMFISSLLVTRNPFDFSVFLSNHSEKADMTINYFNLGSMRNYLLLKLLILYLIIASLFSIKKEKFIQFTCILFLCIFNPFCCSFLYKVLIVYYRAFDIIVNPFTIVLYISLLLLQFKENAILKVIVYASLLLVILQNSLAKPMYYHATFMIDHNEDGVNYTNYNKEFKMSRDEKEIIDAIYEDSIYYDIQTPYIITPSLLTQGCIPNGRYMYVRTKPMRYKNDYDKQLFAIFYPERYFGERVKNIECDYDNIEKYINEAKIDYLVVDKTKEYYDERIGSYIYLHAKVSESFYPMFENNRYVVYRCFYQ